MRDLQLYKEDYIYLDWNTIRSSAGTAGSFLKATENIRGINWNDIVTIDVNCLRNAGESIAIPYRYFKKFAQNNIVNTAGACDMLGCSRQNIDDMVKRSSLEPVHASAKNKMFLK